MSHSILLTGSSGFIGRNLLTYFKDKQSVFLNISRNPKQEELSYDDLNTTVWNHSTVCIHLAGNNQHTEVKEDEGACFTTNTKLTIQLFNQFLKSTCEVFIYMSSVKASADKVSGVLMETDITNPLTAYGKSKLAAEQYILEQKIPQNKRVYILRPCMVHGPNNKGNLKLLYSFVSKGIPYPFGKFKNKRSFVSIDNLCFVIEQLMANNTIENGIYNVADDVPLSTNQLVSLVGEIINKPCKVWNVPKIIIKILAQIGDVIPLPINTERLEKLTENYVVSNQKIKKAIGMSLPLSVEKGIEKTIKSFQ